MNCRVFVSTLAATAVAAADPAPKLKLCIFSKHLQWAKWDEMAAFAKSAGFDGVDLTVRSGGHVLPERVADDLPRAVEAIRKAGLEAPMITAGIVDASSPHAEAILAAASGLGIPRYKVGRPSVSRRPAIACPTCAFSSASAGARRYEPALQDHGDVPHSLGDGGPARPFLGTCGKYSAQSIRNGSV